MRLAIKFKSEKIPMAYSMMIVSLIKSALQKSDSTYFESLYYFNGKKNKKTKPYSFAFRMSDFNIDNENNEFQLKGESTLYITTSDIMFFTNLYNGIIKIKEEVNYKGYIYKITSIRKLQEKKIKKEENLFKAISPIVICNKQGKFLSPKDDEFEKELNYTANMILKNLRGTGLKRSLIFTEVMMKKRVMKEKIDDFINETGKEFIYITGYEGVFKLLGDIEDIEFLYNSGISLRRSQGAGYLEIMC